MSRMVRRPIAVTRWRLDEPESFIDHGEIHSIVDVLDRWLEMGDWWLGEGERKMLRVWTDQNALLELELYQQQWFIYKAWD